MIDPAALDALTCALLAKPRFPLGQFPTPLDDAPRLSERLGCRVLVKRDDATGLALGGNKVRKLEFLIGDAVAAGADVIVTTGGSQSNHARLTAAACRKAGLACRLVLNRGPHNDVQGNLLLDLLLDASVQWVESEDPADAVPAMEAVADDLRAEGHTPYVIPRGGSIPQGATGYAAMIAELLPQLDALDVSPTALYLATGSTGTHSGTLAGLTAAGVPLPVRGVSVSRPADLQEAKVRELATATLRHLGFENDLAPDSARVDDRFRGPGYGYPTEETLEAITIAARDEALVLDPVYTGKAMAGLIGHAREGRLGPDDTVIFLHTGGSPALFAYNREMEAMLEGPGS
jgi:D-cysteine desulfhydrase family pyridoxal phosphate-dependent enzyme